MERKLKEFKEKEVEMEKEELRGEVEKGVKRKGK